MTHVTGAPLMDVTRARDGSIWTCRHMRHPVLAGKSERQEDEDEQHARSFCADLHSVPKINRLMPNLTGTRGTAPL